MSGGAFNYLCFADPEELFAKRKILRDMVDELAGLDATDAAAETETVLLVLNQFEARMHARLSRLQDIWKAVEWWRSGDYGRDQVIEAIAAYRKELEPPSLNLAKSSEP